MSGVEEIREFMQRRHGTVLPDVDVRYSDNIDCGFTVSPMPDWYSEDGTPYAIRDWNGQLKARGLSDAEIERHDRTKYTIYFPSSYLDSPIVFQAGTWEEMGHVLAFTLKILDRVQNESVALTYRFIGLTRAAKIGLLGKEEVLNHLELCWRSTAHERAHAFMFRKLGQMGLKVRQELKEPHYYKSFFAIRRYNEKMVFRGRDLDGIMQELDRSLDYALALALGRQWGKKIKSLLAKILS